MHKWKLFKKSAALVLSSAVIASGMPVTAMASEAEVFSDVSEEKMEETAQEADEEFQPESSEESDVEDIQEEDGTIHAEPAHMYVQNGKRETTQALSAMMITGETNRALTL